MISGGERRIYKNTFAMVLRTLLSVPIGFLSVRIALGILGAADYGLTNVLGTLTSFVYVLSGCIANTAKRYLCCNLASADEQETANLFSMLLLVYWIVAVVLTVVLEGFGCWMILKRIRMPEEMIPVALLFYQTVVVSFIMKFVGGAYNVFLTAQECISHLAWITLLESVLHLAFLIVLKYIGNVNMIIGYGLVSVLSCAITMGLFYLTARRLFPVVSRFHFYVNGVTLRGMLSFTSWQLVSGISYSLGRIVSGVVLNNYFTSILNAAQGISDMVNQKIAGFGLCFLSASQPQIIKLCVQGRIEELENLALRITKFSFFVLVLLGFPIFININEILSLWLKEVPPYSVPFAIIGYLTALMDVACIPCGSINDATGKIRGVQLTRAALVWLSVAVTYLGVCWGHGPIWIPMVNLVFIIAMNLVRFTFIKLHVPEFRVGHFMLGVVRYMVSVAFVCSLPIMFYRLVGGVRSLGIAVLSSFLMFIFCGGVILYLGLAHSERQELYAIIKRKIGTFI